MSRASFTVPAAGSRERLRVTSCAVLVPLLNERRVLGGRRRRISLHPDFAQLYCLLLLGPAVHKVLQEARPEGVALHIQHCACAVAKKKKNKTERMTGETNIIGSRQQSHQEAKCTWIIRGGVRHIGSLATALRQHGIQ